MAYKFKFVKGGHFFSKITTAHNFVLEIALKWISMTLYSLNFDV